MTRSAVTCVALLFTSIAFSQTDPVAGVQPFSPQLGGPYDFVNPSTGNIVLIIPVRDKTGKTPFSVKLVDNSHAFIRALSPTSNGWFVSTQISTKPFSSLGVTVSYTTTHYSCYGPQQEYILNGFTATDPTGAAHPFNLSVTYGYCGSSIGAGTATDGSGYTINVTSASPLVYTLYDRAGNAVTTSTANGVTTRTLTDPDSTTISSSQNTSTLTTTYTDTLGTTALTSTYGEWSGGSDTHTYADALGQTQKVQVNYATYPLKTNFGCANIAELDWTGLTMYFPTSIVMPDGSAFSITYEKTPGYPADITGRIATISYPSGGSVTYTYSGGNNGVNCSSAVVPTLTRRVNDNNGNVSTWTYVNSNSSGTSGNYTVTSTDPSGNHTVQTFSGGYLTETQVYQGAVSPSNLLGSTVTCYNGNFANCPSLSTPPTSVTQTDVFTYPTGSTSASLVETKLNTTGTVAELKRYDFGAATTLPPTAAPTISPVFDTSVSYDGQNGASCGALSISYMYNRPCTVTTTGSGHTVSSATYTYNAAGHPTQVSRWVSGTTYLTSQTSFNGNGTVNVATDANGGVSTFAYNGTGGCNGLLPTSVTLTGTGLPAGGLTTSHTWDCNGGVVTSNTDANNQETDSVYNDPMWRITSFTDELENMTTYRYSPTATDSTLLFNNSTAETGIGLDGLGREIVTNHQQAPGSSTWDTYPQSYDSNGRVSKVYMPCATGIWTCSTPYTSITYDVLNRPLVTTDGGLGTITRSYSHNDVLVTGGPAPTGENAKSRQYEYDGLGRLTSVCEILASGGTTCGQNTPASGYKTSYAYSVPAAGGSQMVVTQGAQTRTYIYNGLGHLISETNPESGNRAPGTTSYSYDPYSFCWYAGADGDLHTRTDNAGNVTCYHNDQLHRLIDVARWANNTWVIGSCQRLRYDTVSSGVIPAPVGYSAANTQGRLIEAETDDCSAWPPTPITDEWFSYDARGQMTDMWQKTPNSGGYYHTTAGYAANGAVTSLGLPAAAGSWTYTLDGEGRPFSASNASTVNVASVTYNPASQPLVISYSSLGKDNDTYTYYDTTGRMKTYAFTIGSTPKTITGTYGWNQNGTIQNVAITDPFYATDQQTCNYLYDDLSRLSSVDCGATVWQQNFAYDAYGNITKSVPSGGTGITWNPGYSAATNQYTLGGTTYDSDGNLTYDTFNHYTWDGYGQMATINNNAITYDALGREVEKSNPTREILYSPVGKVAIMNGATTVSTSFVPMPGGSSINALSGSTFIRHMNLQNTASVFSSLLNRQVYEDKAFAPFGEVYNVGLAGGGETDFAGLSQDTLTGVNDSATRKEYPNQGRWLSPDPAGLSATDTSNPQTLNRYAYVANSPLSNIDPAGTMCFPSIEGDCSGMSGLQGTDYFNGTSCDPTLSGSCVFTPFTPFPGKGQGWGNNNGSSFNFGFDAQFSFDGGGDIWSEWMPPIPTSPGQAISNVIGLVMPQRPCETEFGAPCVQQGNSFGPGAVLAGGGTLEGICIIAEPCGAAELIFGGLFLGTVATIDTYQYYRIPRPIRDAARAIGVSARALGDAVEQYKHDNGLPPDFNLDYATILLIAQELKQGGYFSK